jgi:hypothetical protein
MIDPQFDGHLKLAAGERIVSALRLPAIQRAI